MAKILTLTLTISIFTWGPPHIENSGFPLKLVDDALRKSVAQKAHVLDQ
jgi:hypothetical protein